MEFLSPARVNLIGEHTDYTGGLVLPMAIPLRSIATIQPSDAGAYEFSSENFPSTPKLQSAEAPRPVHEWSDYPVGVLCELLALGIKPPPFRLHLRGNVPLGAGLSRRARYASARRLFEARARREGAHHRGE